MARPEPAWTPASRDGVGASRVAVGAGPWPGLLSFLVARFPAVDDWALRLAQGNVLDASGRILAADAPGVPGMLLWYWRRPPPAARRPPPEPRVPVEIDLLHQDEHLVVVDKPHFLPVIPGGRHLQETVLVRLKRQLGAVWAEQGGPIEPPQLLPGAEGPGLPEPPPGPLAHYRLTPRTGRKHQLRVQLSALGMAIVGDRIYPRLWPEPAADAVPDYSQPLQLLARELAFVDPLSGVPRRFASRRRLQWAIHRT